MFGLGAGLAIGGIASGLGVIGSGIASIFGAKKGSDSAERMNEENLAFQREKLDYDKALQQRIFDREDTAYQRTFNDIYKSGFNPLSAQGINPNNAGEAINTQAPQNDVASVSNAYAKETEARVNFGNALMQAGLNFYQAFDTMKLQRDGLNAEIAKNINDDANTKAALANDLAKTNIELERAGLGNSEMSRYIRDTAREQYQSIKGANEWSDRLNQSQLDTAKSQRALYDAQSAGKQHENKIWQQMNSVPGLDSKYNSALHGVKIMGREVADAYRNNLEIQANSFRDFFDSIRGKKDDAPTGPTHSGKGHRR